MLAEGKSSERLLRVLRAWFGWAPGGTAGAGATLCAFFTLFTVMTLEGWVDGVTKPIIEHHPYAWIFFFTFIVVTNSSANFSAS